MLVNRQFLRDFAELANLYGWEGQVLEEVKQQTRESAELRAYWAQLARAHRQGYEQRRDNNWIRVEHWKQSK